MKRIISLLIMIAILTSCIYVYADSKEYVFDYYTFSLPDEYTKVDETSSKIEALSANGMETLTIAKDDLSIYNIPNYDKYSQDQSSQLNTAVRFFTSGASGMELGEPYDSGMINGAAYLIAPLIIGSNYILQSIIVVSLLKNNHFLIAMFMNVDSNGNFQKAEDFLKSITVSNELPTESYEINYEWKAENVGDATRVSFVANNKVITLDFPHPYEVYMPGMGEDCALLDILETTTEELERAFYTFHTTMDAYVFAYNSEEDVTQLVIVNTLVTGMDEENDIIEYTEGQTDVIFSNQFSGAYEKKTINGRLFYSFPDRENGYRINTVSGPYNIALLCISHSGIYSDQLIQSTEKIAGSIIVENTENTESSYTTSTYNSDANDETNVFVFRDGIKWGMTKDEVFSLENSNSVDIAISPKNGFDILAYSDVTVSKFRDAMLLYGFYQDYLTSAIYAFDAPNPSDLDYLRKALTQKYGKTLELSRDEIKPVLEGFVELMNATMEDGAELMNIDDLTEEEVSESVDVWKESEETYILGLGDNELYMLAYLHPFQIEYDINGL